MKKLLLITILTICIQITNIIACDCGPALSEASLDEKVYSGANYTFFTAEILEVESAFHLEVTVQIDQIFYGSRFVKDRSKPITIYFDLRTSCAITQIGNIKAGNKLFITSAYNTMGRMFITNNCDAFFPLDQIETLHLTEYLNGLKSVE